MICIIKLDKFFKIINNFSIFYNIYQKKLLSQKKERTFGITLNPQSQSRI